MVRLVEPNITEPAQNSLDRHPPLDPRERASRAAVRAARERHVLPGVGSIHPQLGRAVEMSRIPIRRAGQQHDLRTRVQTLQPRAFQPPAVGKTQKCRGYSGDGVVHTLSTLIFNRVLNAARYSSPIPILTA